MQKIPAGPQGHPVIGNLLDYMRDPLSFCLRGAREFGDVLRLRVPGLTSYQLNHPDLIDSVLVRNQQNFVKDRYTRDLRNLLGNGILVSEGDFWRRQRRLAQPAFHPKRVESYGQIMVDSALRLLSGWSDGQRFDVHEQMMRLTMEIVARTLFDADVSSDAAEIGAAFDDIMKDHNSLLSMARIFLPPGLRLLGELPTPSRIRRIRAVRRLDRTVYRIIAERRVSGQDRGDLLSMLLHAQDEDGASMTDQQVRNESVTLFAAGHETTALALSFTWYLLALHPKVAERLRIELDSVLGERSPTVSDMPRLRYTEWVVRESMRLYPPAWAIGREALTDCELGGYHVPAGTQILIAQWVMHRDPRYFEQPEEFRPERWDGDFAKRLPRFAYFPFGGGPRVCIGNSFAMMEAILLLATIARSYELRLERGFKLELFPSITLRPKHGIPMILTKRPNLDIAGAGASASREDEQPRVSSAAS